MNPFFQPIGSFYDRDNSEFVVWAPLRERVELILAAPTPAVYPMQKDGWGYWRTSLRAAAGSTYWYRLDGTTRCPDPASISQPEGVHGPSELCDRNGFAWTDGDWQGIPVSNMVIYELHVGCFSATHDFDGVIARLDYLVSLGVNSIELMPVAQFPGQRNWGYDGVCPFAVQDSYGGRAGLKRLVDAAHAKGIAVILDVVYNHLGPEGNYLREFGPYFTSKYCTPWGDALNFDDVWSDGVRNFFLQNTGMWLEEFHVDALRLDAVHAIRDFSAHPFIRELKERVLSICQATGRKRELIAELDLNDIRFLDPPEKGGYELDAQWNDEFHHALHGLLTGETTRYYEDFGTIDQLASAFRDTFVYHGNYSEHRKRRFGSRVGQTGYDRFIVFSQNHDQVGNRAQGDRLTERLNFEQLKLAAASVLLSPYVPLLFMGEEFGEDNPFLFFTHFGDAELIRAIREGRRNEFGYARPEELPDPQDIESFNRSNLSWRDKSEPGATLFRFYRHLIRFRKERPAMQAMDRASVIVHPPNGNMLCFERGLADDRLLVCLNFHGHDVSFHPPMSPALRLVLDSSEAEWRGPGRSGLCESAPGGEIRINSFAAAVYEYNHKPLC